jgi:hypothetical protein
VKGSGSTGKPRADRSRRRGAGDRVDADDAGEARAEAQGGDELPLRRRVGQHRDLRAEAAADLDGLDGHRIDDAVLGAGAVDHQQRLAGAQARAFEHVRGRRAPGLPMKEKR